MVNGDDHSVLTSAEYMSQQRSLHWEIDPKTSKMFSALDKKVDDNMESRGIIYHNHINMIKKSAIETKGVFKITQVDKENPDMVVGYEAIKYPITAILWHPEYQYLELKKGLPPTMAK